MSQSRPLVRVAVPVPLADAFDYLVPPGGYPPPIGARVRVPFGRGERIGLMKFGSRMDVFLPPDADLRIGVGERVDAALDADMALNLAIGSERQKIAYLSMIAERTERTLSFHLRLQPDNPEAARLAVGTLLRRLPGLRVAPGAELRYRLLPGFKALESLPVVWGPPAGG